MLTVQCHQPSDRSISNTLLHIEIRKCHGRNFSYLPYRPRPELANTFDRRVAGAKLGDVREPLKAATCSAFSGTKKRLEGDRVVGNSGHNLAFGIGYIQGSRDSDTLKRGNELHRSMLFKNPRWSLLRSLIPYGGEYGGNPSGFCTSICSSSLNGVFRRTEEAVWRHWRRIA